MNIDWNAPMSDELNYLLYGFILYVFTNFLFEFWHKNILWKRIVLMWGEIITYCALAWWLATNHSESTDFYWLVAIGASISAIVMPFLSVVFEILLLITVYLFNSFWSLTHIEHIYIVSDTTNPWVRYLVLAIRQ